VTIERMVKMIGILNYYIVLNAYDVIGLFFSLEPPADPP